MQEARRPTPEERRELIKLLVDTLAIQDAEGEASAQRPRSLLKLAGLGAESGKGSMHRFMSISFATSGIALRNDKESYVPAKDRYHDTVKRALIKDGWRVTHEQYFLNYEGRHLWIDLRADRLESQDRLLVEIKGFEDTDSPVDYLEAALGQYSLYLAVLEALEIAIPVYRAVPLAAHTGFLRSQLARLVSAGQG